MKKRIGIPRALLFIEYLDLIVNFFSNLDAQVIISETTNKKILDNGVQVAVDDACLPIKLFHGHVINLKDKVDYIFIPRIMSINEKEHICPKFGGLPELIRYSINDLPPIITTEINNYYNKEALIKSIYDIGLYITKDKEKIMNAYKKAYRVYKLSRGKFKVPIVSDKKSTTNNLNVLAVGHSYNLYDTYSNMNLFNKLKNNNTTYVTPEMLDNYIIDKYANEYKGRQYWTFSKKIIGSVIYSIRKYKVDGIIYVTSFSCGIDSVVIDIVERIAKQHNTSVLILSIDEHTGEAGINTRIEAFIDMLERRKNNDSNVSTYGEHLYTNKSSARGIRG